MHSNLEHAEEFLLQGWAFLEKNLNATVSVDIHINRRFIARVPAHTFRSDLQANGFGDGYHAFYFNPLDYLACAENLIEVKESASNAMLNSGSRLVKSNFATSREAYRQARTRASAGWNNLSESTNSAAAEKAFLNRLELAAHFHPGLRILEIGSGEGQLFGLMRQRKKYFSSYTGLDLSRSHVNSLHSRFGSSKTNFLACDAATYPFTHQFDLVIASSVCEGLFPSFQPTMANVSKALIPGGLAVFDLIVQDDRASISRAEWQGDRWLRLYSEREIRRLLNDCGLEVLDSRIYAKSAGEHRLFVTALKIYSPVRNNFENT